MNYQDLKAEIEKATGKKVTVSFKKSGSMKGYVCFKPKGKTAEDARFPFEAMMELGKKYQGTDRNPNFFSVQQVNYYIGNEVFNQTKECKNCKAELHKHNVTFCPTCKAEIVEKREEEASKLMFAATTNYGRAKGESSKNKSGGWGKNNQGRGPNQGSKFMKGQVTHVFEKGGILGEDHDKSVMSKYMDLLGQIGRERFLGYPACELKIVEDKNEGMMYLTAADQVQAVLITTRNDLNNCHYDFIDFGRTWEDYPYLKRLIGK